MNKEPTNAKKRLYKRNYTFKKRFLKIYYKNNGLRFAYFKARNIFINEKSKQKYIKNTAKLNDIKEYILICKTTYKREFNEYILIFGNKPIKKLFKGVFIYIFENVNLYGIETNKKFENIKNLLFKYSVIDFKHATDHKYKIKIIYSRNTTE